MTTQRITREDSIPDEFDAVAIAKWRAENRKRIEAIHPANRFRLMFGLPELPEGKPTQQDETPAK